jgi:urea transport system permease protein
VDVLIGQLATGLSLGSILFPAALGLSLTFGQMAVINMAHGGFIMVGCYTAYVVQQAVGIGLASGRGGMLVLGQGCSSASAAT